jgi:hypothetical protein
MALQCKKAVHKEHQALTQISDAIPPSKAAGCWIPNTREAPQQLQTPDAEYF